MPNPSASQVLEPEAIEAQLKERLPGWTFTDGQLWRCYKTGKWPRTVMLFNAIAYLAEAADHHPDVTLTYGALEIRLITHSAGGITEKDFALAAQIEALRD